MGFLLYLFFFLLTEFSRWSGTHRLERSTAAWLPFPDIINLVPDLSERQLRPVWLARCRNYVSQSPQGLSTHGLHRYNELYAWQLRQVLLFILLMILQIGMTLLSAPHVICMQSMLPVFWCIKLHFQSAKNAGGIVCKGLFHIQLLKLNWLGSIRIFHSFHAASVWLSFSYFKYSCSLFSMETLTLLQTVVSFKFPLVTACSCLMGPESV